MTKTTVPQYHALMNPLLQALKALGGSGTNEEIENKTAEVMGLSDEQLEIPHSPSKGGQTQFQYRLAWARTYLKKYGLIDNSSRGVWALTPAGAKTDHVDEKKIVRSVREQVRQARQEAAEEELEEGEDDWRSELMEALLKLEPSAFERLVQRLLRECGFVQVEVTGRSGDGGIDGHGILRLGGLLSFHVIFQCKRYQGAVAPSQVRDFRGAMVGRADKGLLITTGTFTKEAAREATRDGAPAIDLIDGEQLLNKLKELSLGVRVRQVEEITVDREWLVNV
jgi:restriction system protein